MQKVKTEHLLNYHLRQEATIVNFFEIRSFANVKVKVSANIKQTYAIQVQTGNETILY